MAVRRKKSASKRKTTKRATTTRKKKTTRRKAKKAFSKDCLISRISYDTRKKSGAGTPDFS